MGHRGSLYRVCTGGTECRVSPDSLEDAGEVFVSNSAVASGNGCVLYTAPYSKAGHEEPAADAAEMGGEALKVA